MVQREKRTFSTEELKKMFHCKEKKPVKNKKAVVKKSDNQATKAEKSTKESVKRKKAATKTTVVKKKKASTIYEVEISEEQLVGPREDVTKLKQLEALENNKQQEIEEITESVSSNQNVNPEETLVVENQLSDALKSALMEINDTPATSFKLSEEDISFETESFEPPCSTFLETLELSPTFPIVQPTFQSSILRDSINSFPIPNAAVEAAIPQMVKSPQNQVLTEPLQSILKEIMDNQFQLKQRLDVLEKKQSCKCNCISKRDIEKESILSKENISTSVTHASHTAEKPGELSFTELNALKSSACSASNFASKLAEKLFSVEERRKNNTSGTRGKGKLDERKIAYIHRTVFEMYPVGADQVKEVWRLCKNAINEFGRRPIRH